MDESDRPFEPPSPGSWHTIDFIEADHEAAHAVACHLLGLEVFEARIDRPLVGRRGERETIGHVVHEKPCGQDRWKGICTALAPLILTNRCPEYPSLHADDGDEFQAAVHCYELKVDKEDYDGYVTFIREFLELPSSKRELKAVSRALLEHGALNGDDIRRVLEEAKTEDPRRVELTADEARHFFGWRP